MGNFSLFSGLLFYFFILFFSIGFLKLYNYILKICKTINIIQYRNNMSSLFLFLFMISSIIFAYTFRYGIGTDYFAYESIYEDLRKVSLLEYIEKHSQNIGSYYVEPGYFILNRYLCFNYTSLNFIISLVMMSALYYGIISVNHKSSVSLGLLIYFCTQFIYSMNGVRFSIAVTVILFGFQFILKKKLLLWILCVVIAMGFHKTSVICAPLYLMRDIKNKKLSIIRNFFWYIFVLFFPAIALNLLSIASKTSFLNRYFLTSVYALGSFSFKPMFLFHILPVLLPLLVIKGKFILRDKKALLLFNICLYEIPLRELGSFNTWLARLARFPQVFQILLVPYILESVKDKRTKIFLKIYYLLWYVFYFIHYAVVVDESSSLPYKSIFF